MKSVPHFGAFVVFFEAINCSTKIKVSEIISNWFWVSKLWKKKFLINFLNWPLQLKKKNLKLQTCNETCHLHKILARKNNFDIICSNWFKKWWNLDLIIQGVPVLVHLLQIHDPTT